MVIDADVEVTLTVVVWRLPLESKKVTAHAVPTAVAVMLTGNVGPPVSGVDGLTSAAALPLRPSQVDP